MRPGAAGPARVGRPEEAPLLGGPRSAALLTGPPELSTGGGRESSKPALAEAATGLTLPLADQHPRKRSPRKGPHRPPADKEIGSYPDKGLLGAPAALLGM